MRLRRRHAPDIWRILLGTLICAAVCTGCVQIAPTPEPVTIQFVTFGGEPVYEPLVEQFHQEYPYITVEIVTPRGPFFDDIDVLAVSPSALPFIRDRIPLRDLTPFIQGDESFKQDDFYPGMIDMFTRENEDSSEVEIWAVPSAIDVAVMYYNQELFDAYNVPYPQIGWTWDDFLRTAQALYDPEAGVFGYAPDYRLNDPLYFIYLNGGKIFDDLQNPTRTTFNDARTIEALEWYAKLMYGNAAAATPHQARQAYGPGDYVQFGIDQKRLGMWTGGLSERGGRLRQEAWPVKWGVVPLPQGAQLATFASLEGYAITTTAEDPEACWTWISFLTRQISVGGLPARRSLVESRELEDEMGKEAAATAREAIQGTLFFAPNLYDRYGTLQLYTEAVNMIVEQQKPPQEAMNWAQQQSKLK